MNGYIAIHRQIEKWEWYTDIPTKVLFLHLLIKAQHEDINFRGQTIKRGQLVTSRKKLSEETGLSEQQIRRAINNLQNTQEITSKATNKNTLITIEKYAQYQLTKNKNNQQNNQQTTNNATNKQPTNNQPTNNNVNNINNNNNTQKKNIKRKGYSVEEQIAKIESKVLQEDLQDFVTMRQTIKDPITDRGMKILINKLAKLSEGNENKAHELLEEAIEKNWKSVYPKDERQRKSKKQNEFLELLNEMEQT